MVVTVYITWWFLTFFDNFFSVRPTLPGPLADLADLIVLILVRLLFTWPG
jgi:hypothetical protein